MTDYVQYKKHVNFNNHMINMNTNMSVNSNLRNCVFNKCNYNPTQFLIENNNNISQMHNVCMHNSHNVHICSMEDLREE